ncbi:hypothetical protein KL86PLE_70079 [uncultured Pleomorphomonas sp.]|uniref:Uncharacterized protein n=1 Tax=uncultured Pleomorphomonas sp. TaxID=442121 RepID=A0A212LLA7_9HYPH|nr:hypothetical protein KL86PLE_70079 [uncultured Pleomorphomonas sp.]
MVMQAIGKGIMGEGSRLAQDSRAKSEWAIENRHYLYGHHSPEMLHCRPHRPAAPEGPESPVFAGVPACRRSLSSVSKAAGRW